MNESVWVLAVTVADTGVQPVKAISGSYDEANKIATEHDRPLWVLGKAELVE